MERGYARLNDADKQALLKLGYTVLTEKIENNMHEEDDFIVYQSIKISVYRYDGAMTFCADVAQSKHGYRIRDTWNSFEDEPRERQLRPKNIFTGITESKVKAWLDHCVFFFDLKVKKYEAMLQLYEARQAECVSMGGKWEYAHQSYWDKKEGKKPEKSLDDYFTVESRYFGFKKTVYGNESIEFMNWKVDDNKSLFLKLQSIAKNIKAEVE